MIQKEIKIKKVQNGWITTTEETASKTNVYNAAYEVTATINDAVVGQVGEMKPGDELILRVSVIKP